MIAQQHLVAPDLLTCHTCRQPIAGPIAYRRLVDRVWFCVGCWVQMNPPTVPKKLQRKRKGAEQ